MNQGSKKVSIIKSSAPKNWQNTVLPRRVFQRSSTSSALASPKVKRQKLKSNGSKSSKALPLPPPRQPTPPRNKPTPDALKPIDHSHLSSPLDAAGGLLPL